VTAQVQMETTGRVDLLEVSLRTLFREPVGWLMREQNRHVMPLDPVDKLIAAYGDKLLWTRGQSTLERTVLELEKGRVQANDSYVMASLSEGKSEVSGKEPEPGGGSQIRQLGARSKP